MRAYSCPYGISLLFSVPHSHTQSAHGMGMHGAAAFGGFFSAVAGRQTGERKETVQEMGKNELVEAGGGGW